MKKNYLAIGGIIMLTSVILGAFGAHYFEIYLSEQNMEIYDTAVFYQFIHGITLLILGIVDLISPKADFETTGLIFITGIILFSGSLYILAIFKEDLQFLVKTMVVILTPVGGVFLIAGWFSFIFNVKKIKKV